MSSAWYLLHSSQQTTSRNSSERTVAFYATAATVTALAVGSLWIQRRRRARQKNQHHYMYQQTITLRDIKGNAKAKASDIVNGLYKNIVVGKVYVITGATSGLGRFTAVLLGKAGAHVILGVRNVAQGEQVRQEILNQGNGSNGSGTATVIHLDLTSLDSTRQFCLEVKALLAKLNPNPSSPTAVQLHGIVNNAGVYGVKGVTSENNIQTTWQVNALAPALLTELLLPVLDRENGRVIHVSSELYQALLWRRVSDHCPPPTSCDGSTTFDYALSKASEIVHAHGLNRQFAAERFPTTSSTSSGSSTSQQRRRQRRRAFAIEPGLVQTNIARHKGKLVSFINYSILGPFLLRSMDQGCASIVFCLLAPAEDLLMEGDNDDDDDDGDHWYYYANCAPKTIPKAVANVEQVTAQAQLFEQLLAKYK